MWHSWNYYNVIWLFFSIHESRFNNIIQQQQQKTSCNAFLGFQQYDITQKRVKGKHALCQVRQTSQQGQQLNKNTNTYMSTSLKVVSIANVFCESFKRVATLFLSLGIGTCNCNRFKKWEMPSYERFSLSHATLKSLFIWDLLVFLFL